MAGTVFSLCRHRVFLGRCSPAQLAPLRKFTPDSTRAYLIWLTRSFESKTARFRQLVERT